MRGRIHRLIAASWPTTGVFDSVASPADARAALVLAALTDDSARAMLDRMALLPDGEWVLGLPGAQLIMAAFFHPAPGGGRFNAESLGAWYTAREVDTAIAETVYHHTRRLRHSTAGFHAAIWMRELVCRIDASLHEIRGWGRRRPRLFDADDYAASQPFGEALRAGGSNGIVYRSVRRPAGENVVVFRPKMLLPIDEGARFEYHWTGDPAPRVMRLTPVR